MSGLAAYLGLDPTDAYRQLNYRVRERHVHSVRSRQGLATNGFRAADVGVFKVLTVLHDAGVKDPGIFDLASLALYAWSDDAPPDGRHPSPVCAAMAGACEGEHWTLGIWLYRHDQSGQRQIVVLCHPADREAFRPVFLDDPGWQPLSVSTIPLTPILKPLAARMLAAVRTQVTA